MTFSHPIQNLLEDEYQKKIRIINAPYRVVISTILLLLDVLIIWKVVKIALYYDVSISSLGAFSSLLFITPFIFLFITMLMTEIIENKIILYRLNKHTGQIYTKKDIEQKNQNHLTHADVKQLNTIYVNQYKRVSRMYELLDLNQSTPEIMVFQTKNQTLLESLDSQEQDLVHQFNHTHELSYDEAVKFIIAKQTYLTIHHYMNQPKLKEQYQKANDVSKRQS